MMRRLASYLILLSAGTAAGCSDAAERSAARDISRRNVCIAEELHITARGRLADLDDIIAKTPASPLQGVNSAAREFASATEQHASRRASELAMTDSAIAVRSAEDSARLAAEAARLRVAGGGGSPLQQNVASQYEREFNAAAANPAHPCNQENRSDG